MNDQLQSLLTILVLFSAFATKAGLPSSTRPNAVQCAGKDSSHRCDIVASVTSLNLI
jgi:hypothetical protein